MKNQQGGNIQRSKDAAIIWEPRRTEIVFLYHEQGMSQAELAAHYGVAQSSMFKILGRLGISAKSRGRKGKANARYINGEQSTLYRKMIRKASCEKCGAKKKLVIHHRNLNHFDDALTNLQVLCSPCHSSLHKSLWWKTRKSQSSQTLPMA